jgi:hypothetical protein
VELFGIELETPNALARCEGKYLLGGVGLRTRRLQEGIDIKQAFQRYYSPVHLEVGQEFCCSEDWQYLWCCWSEQHCHNYPNILLPADTKPLLAVLQEQ